MPARFDKKIGIHLPVAYAYRLSLNNNKKPVCMCVCVCKGSERSLSGARESKFGKAGKWVAKIGRACRKIAFVEKNA